MELDFHLSKQQKLEIKSNNITGISGRFLFEFSPIMAHFQIRIQFSFMVRSYRKDKKKTTDPIVVVEIITTDEHNLDLNVA